MEALARQPRDEGDARMVDQLPVHVVAALDHLTRPEREGVLATISAFSRHEQHGHAIPGTDRLFLIWAAPELRVIVRRAAPDAPVEVEDIVRPATLRAFAEVDAW